MIMDLANLQPGEVFESRGERKKLIYGIRGITLKLIKKYNDR
jgi:hypothetical protein